MSLNRVMLIGRLGKDPETRYTTGGEAVTNVSLAKSESWKDKAGEKQERTEWHNLVFYSRLAEVASEYLKKGSLVYVEGKLTTEKWQTKEGQERYTTKVIVGRMEMLDGKRTEEGPVHERESAPVPRTAAEPKQRPAGFDNFDDDIPF